MHSKKKLVVSQLALACTLAITSQANAANYDTWGIMTTPRPIQFGRMTLTMMELPMLAAWTRWVQTVTT